MTELNSIYNERAVYSKARLTELANRIRTMPEVSDYTDLAIFGAGSFARYEASEHSDIDMFFVCKRVPEPLSEPHTCELRLFGKLIDTISVMGFPKFSNDCEYLRILHASEILENMGKPEDDHKNYFTVRMLLLLESKCLFGKTNYNDIVSDIISSYFRDYPDHEQTFRPIFLLNDICRFWKTLLMNYECKRGGSDQTEAERTAQKVRNFKLKFSRMTTCFASIASICSYTIPVREEEIIQQTSLTPRERLESIPARMSQAEEAVQEVLKRYAFFLAQTGLTTEELESHFSDKTKRTDMFRVANEYGDSMYKLLQVLDGCQADDFKFLRYLVI